MKITALASAVLMLLCAAVSTNQEPSTQSRPQKSAAKEISIADFAWMAGHFRGEAMGGQFEETWNPPLGDSMIGMFKLVKDGELVFTELILLSKVDGVFTMQVRHFDSKHHAWEEKDETVKFPIVSVAKNKAIFNGLTFEKLSDDRVKIVVNVKNEDTTEKMVFNAERVKSEQTED